MATPAIHFEGLTVRYGARTALAELTAQIPGGSLVALLGPNGAGKSTLLRAILGWHEAAGGRVRLGGEMDRRGRPPARVAYLPQHPEVDWDFPITVRSVVAQGRYDRRWLFRRLGAEDHAAVERALADLDLQPVADRPIRQLSGGQQQRMFLARAVAQDAEILLLDEPFAGLDPRATEELAGLLVRWQAQGRTVVAAVHDLAVARTYFRRALLINTRLIAEGTVDEVLAPIHLRAAFGATP